MALGKILVVDDDTNICELLRLYMEKDGYSVSIANDGETAVKAFSEVQPDIVLLDIMLPKMAGLQGNTQDFGQADNHGYGKGRDL